jgi:thymidylate synthase
MTNTPNRFDSLDDAFRWVVEAIVRDGEPVAPRTISTKELRGISISISDPRRRYVSLAPRRWSFAYALGEFCWHARGSAKLDEISFYSKRWEQMSDDGETVVGSSYGAKIFAAEYQLESQWDVIKTALKSDLSSRRSVLYFGEPLGTASAQSRDVSCATSLQFLVRQRKLEAVATMRSNDAMIGLPYDIFLFTMLQELMAVSLQLEVGPYHHFVGSMHIYESELDAARAIVGAGATIQDSMESMPSVDGLAHLLTGEQQTRRGHSLEHIKPRPDKYWSDLLSVLEYRNGVRLGRKLRLEDIITDPLCRRLARLRTSGV